MRTVLGVLACLAALIVINQATGYHAHYSSPPDRATTHVTAGAAGR